MTAKGRHCRDATPKRLAQAQHTQRATVELVAGQRAVARSTLQRLGGAGGVSVVLGEQRQVDPGAHGVVGQLARGAEAHHRGGLEVVGDDHPLETQTVARSSPLIQRSEKATGRGSSAG